LRIKRNRLGRQFRLDLYQQSEAMKFAFGTFNRTPILGDDVLAGSIAQVLSSGQHTAARFRGNARLVAQHKRNSRERDFALFSNIGEDDCLTHWDSIY